MPGPLLVMGTPAKPQAECLPTYCKHGRREVAQAVSPASRARLPESKDIKCE